ncbi:hypothetical protein V8J88_03530 [Massilia sp. W12]|uniref:hypothetical protein n=1 Tax=Massilia sp. W12 TaxID=3126507 RepID=UPI0030CF47C0
MKTGNPLHFVCAALALCGALHANAREHLLSNQASDDSIYASMMVVGGASVLAGGASEFVLEAVEASGKGVLLILKSALDGSRVSVRASAKIVRDASLATGASVQVAAISTGYVLLASGRVLGLIVNESGQSLVHHSHSREK